MRPIDVIRDKIDTDLMKYHSTTMCEIKSDDHVKNLRGVGLCALVSPINLYGEDAPSMDGDEYAFPVIIINRPGKWMESNISAKYYVMTLNTVKDKASATVGFLVSKTIVQDLEIFTASIDAKKKIKDSKGNPIESMQRENIQDAKSG